MSKREVHPLANLFPMMRREEFEGLKADIAKNGVREPVLVDAEGRVLDGRNRLRACEELGLEPPVQVWNGEGSVAELVLSLNLHRRHLDESQRAMVAARLAKVLETEAVKRKGRRVDLAANLRPGRRCRSARETGSAVNVSERLITSASRVIRDGCEELIAAVDSGTVAVSTAGALCVLSKPEQAATVAGGPAAVSRKYRELRAGSSTPERVPGRFRLVAQSTGGTWSVSGEAVIVLVALASGGLNEAIEALKARGFRPADGV